MPFLCGFRHGWQGIYAAAPLADGRQNGAGEGAFAHLGDIGGDPPPPVGPLPVRAGKVHGLGVACEILDLGEGEGGGRAGDQPVDRRRKGRGHRRCGRRGGG